MELAAVLKNKNGTEESDVTIIGFSNGCAVIRHGDGSLTGARLALLTMPQKVVPKPAPSKPVFGKNKKK